MLSTPLRLVINNLLLLNVLLIVCHPITNEIIMSNISESHRKWTIVSHTQTRIGQLLSPAIQQHGALSCCPRESFLSFHFWLILCEIFYNFNLLLYRGLRNVRKRYQYKTKILYHKNYPSFYCYYCPVINLYNSFIRK